jgi:hypothetical protein
MAYTAIITEIKSVRNHPNADRLNLGTCYGSQVVIGKNVQEGTKGIYFPTDGQISEEFAQANNLIRRKDENGNNVGGMFDENRRVRTQRFRGEVSDGFWIEITSLEKVKGISKKTIEKLEEGFEFDSLDGVPICQKYVSKKTLERQKNLKQKGKISRPESKMFKEHFDTPQFMRKIEEIPFPSILYFTEKCHGCVDRNTIIETEEMGSITIGEIVDKKLKVKVKAFDTNNQEVVYVPIDDYYFYADDSDWYEIELEDGSKIEITGNNPVWLPELNAYRKVEDLTGDEVLLID